MTTTPALEPTVSSRPVVRLGETVTGLVALTKPRIVELLVITTVPTMFLAAHGVPPVGLIAATVGGGAMSAGGANALNMVYDRDIDALMARTEKRPLVTGVVSPLAAVIFAVLLEMAAFAVLWLEVNLLAASITLAAAAFYLGVYTMWLKRSTPHNIVIGGVAGAAPTLVAWAAVTGTLSATAWGLFAVVTLWTPPHFWALAFKYRDDYSAAHVPMLPSVADTGKVTSQILLYSLVLVAVSVGVVFVGPLGPLYAAGAGALGIGFIARAWQLRRHPNPKRALALFGYSIVYLALLFVGVGVDALVR